MPTLSSSAPTAAGRPDRLALSDDEPDRAFRPGDVIVGGYVVERQLGRGGMGAVYLASDRLSGQRVAVKVLPASLARERGIRERFVREARALAALDHPGIVPLVTFAQEGDERFLVMKYVAGESLEALLERSGVLDPDRATGIVRSMAEALDYAHDRGVIHRDIKPANILIADDGRVVIVDFGIARTSDGGERMTETGMLVGTPHYMSPEQIVGAPVDGRSDLYACGLVLYEMLAGAPPFDGHRTFDILRAHVDQTPLDVAVARATAAPGAMAIPDPLRWLVTMLLQKDPAARPASGRDLIRQLDGITPTPPPPTTTTTRRTTLPQPARATSETPAATLSQRFNDVAPDELEGLTRPPRHPVWLPLAAMCGIAGVVTALGVMGQTGETLDPDAHGVISEPATVTSASRFDEAVLIARARVALDNGRLDDSRVAVEAARALGVDTPALRLTRAELLAAVGQRDDAIAALAAVDLDTLDDEGRTRVGRLRPALDGALEGAPEPALAPPPGTPASAPTPVTSTTRPLPPPPPPSAPTPVDVPPRPSELPDDVLEEITGSTRDRVSACYVEHIVSAHVDTDDGDAPAGEIVLDVRIGRDGGVVEVGTLRADLGSAPLLACVVDAVRAWRFPTFSGGDDHIQHTFSFRARR